MNQKIINIELTSEINSLDEVAIVAFGKQKKSSVIGSMTSVDPEKLKMHVWNAIIWNQILFKKPHPLNTWKTR